MPYDKLVLTGPNRAGKSTTAKALTKYLGKKGHTATIFPSSTVLIDNTYRLYLRDSCVLEKGIGYLTDAVSNDLDLNAEKRSIEECRKFADLLYSKFSPEELADFQIDVAKKKFKSDLTIFDGIRFYDTVNRFKQRKSFVVLLTAPEDVLVERALKEESERFRDMTAEKIREALRKMEREYQFHDIAGIANRIYHTNRFVADFVVRDLLNNLGFGYLS